MSKYIVNRDKFRHDKKDYSRGAEVEIKSEKLAAQHLASGALVEASSQESEKSGGSGKSTGGTGTKK